MHSLASSNCKDELAGCDWLKVLIHGGAWDIPLDRRTAHVAALKEIWGWLAAKVESEKSNQMQGVDPLELVESILTLLEDCGVFDAGVGSFLNECGEVELDAAVMRGRDLAAGGVAAITGFKNPSRVATALLREGQHVLLASEGAAQFAIKSGFQRQPSFSLVHPREVEAHRMWLAAGRPDARIYFQCAPNSPTDCPEKLGTVGVVVALKEGDKWALASGTSTGGTPGKARGRVGDSPIVGAGLYADDLGAAVSCTGWGEAFLRMCAAKAVSDACARGMAPQEAILAVLSEMKNRIGATGGMIAIDRFGRSGAGFSTPDMACIGETLPASL